MIQDKDATPDPECSSGLLYHSKTRRHPNVLAVNETTEIDFPMTCDAIRFLSMQASILATQHYNKI